MPVIIDGYNLLRAIQSTDEEYMDLDELGMCRFLSRYLQRIRDRGHIYFDGMGPPDKTELGELPSMEIYFSGPDREADDLIEQKILDNTAPKRLIVVSTDRRVREAAQKKKAISVRCDLFWPEVVKLLGTGQVTPEPREKRSGISEVETDLWLDVFDLNE